MVLATVAGTVAMLGRMTRRSTTHWASTTFSTANSVSPSRPAVG